MRLSSTNNQKRKEEFNMKTKELVKKVGERIILNSAKRNANNTTCGILFQPSVPSELKKLKRTKNDK